MTDFRKYASAQCDQLLNAAQKTPSEKVALIFHITLTDCLEILTTPMDALMNERPVDLTKEYAASKSKPLARAVDRGMDVVALAGGAGSVVQTFCAFAYTVTGLGYSDVQVMARGNNNRTFESRLDPGLFSHYRSDEDSLKLAVAFFGKTLTRFDAERAEIWAFANRPLPSVAAESHPKQALD